jgi:L-lactate dehydrogenase complex protein LldG
MSAREEILGRVRAALGDVADGPDGPGPGPEAVFGGDPGLSREDLAGLFAERCAEYRATVTRCADEPGAIARALDEAVQRCGVRTIAAPAGLAAQWLALDGVEVLRDEPPLPIARLATVDAALTACAGAIARTGTIVLDAGPDQGRRALTLVPDVHVCVVRAEQIVDRVFESVAPLAEGIAAGRAVTFISGPSATSDIELRRVEGVHGPRTLEVVLAG